MGGKGKWHQEISPLKAILCEDLKNFQKQSPEHKEAWTNFAQNTVGVTTMDPFRHDEWWLEEFFWQLKKRQIVVVESSWGDDWGGGGGFGGKGDKGFGKGDKGFGKGGKGGDQSGNDGGGFAPVGQLAPGTAPY